MLGYLRDEFFALVQAGLRVHDAIRHDLLHEVIQTDAVDLFQHLRLVAFVGPDVPGTQHVRGAEHRRNQR